MIAFHKFRVIFETFGNFTDMKQWRQWQQRWWWCAGYFVKESTVRGTVRLCPSVSPVRTQRLNSTRWRVQIRCSNRLHLGRYSVREGTLGRVCGVHVPEQRPSVLHVAPLLWLLWLLSPISISAVSLKPSCIMHHLWLGGGGTVVGLANSSRPSPQ